MIDRKNTAFATRCIHAGQMPDPTTGAIWTPIYATSTYVQAAPGVHKGLDYGRSHNPTRFAFERALADLEHGKAGFAFSSGLAAMATLLDCLPADSHIIASDDLYGGSFRLFDKVRKKSANLQVTMVDMTQTGAIEQALRPNTRMIWVETPSNPLLKIIDLEMVAALAKKHKLQAVADNTFATPWIQQPLTLGFDVVVHSVTKYLNGHSDMIGGALVVGDDKDLQDQLTFTQNAVGSILSPFDSFLALRGMRTLDIRMQRHCESAARIAAWLQQHPKIEKVYFPGLPSHSNHAIAKKQMRAFGGMVSAVVKGELAATVRMLSACKLFSLAESLGGVESLIEHPAIMTHASIPPEQRQTLGISDSLIRLSVGIEDCDDLMADLDQALGLV